MPKIIIFFLFRCGLLSTLIFTGYKLTKKDINGKYKYEYWAACITSIITYTLIEGLRYGRGVDYKHYMRLYNNALNLSRYYDPSKIEPLFQFINKTFNIFDIPYPLVFCLYSFLLIYAGCYLLKQHRKIMLCGLPLFFLATIPQSENLVRQMMALSFILFSLNFFLTDKWLLSIIFFVLAFLTHTSAVIYLPFFLIFKYINNPFGSIVIILCFYIYASFIWKSDYLNNLSQYISLLQLDQYDQYLSNSNSFFGKDAMHKNYSSSLYFIRFFLFNVCILIMGYHLCDRVQ